MYTGLPMLKAWAVFLFCSLDMTPDGIVLKAIFIAQA
jgi:hypothetical protein